jgi:hypothetical protein
VRAGEGVRLLGFFLVVEVSFVHILSLPSKPLTSYPQSKDSSAPASSGSTRKPILPLLYI